MKFVIFVTLFVIASGDEAVLGGRNLRKEPTVDPVTIPETGLKTNTFYKISMKRFPDSAVSWTSKDDFIDGWHFTQVDYTADYQAKYQKGGEWFKDAQWEFVPESSDGNGNSKWYRLRNRSRPDDYATWSKTRFVNSIDENYKANYIIVDSKYPGARSKSDFLFSLVRDNGESENKEDKNKKKVEYYQLKLKEVPKGVVTFTTKKYGREARYIQVDQDEDHFSKYQKGGEWYDDTLFGFELVEKDDKN